MTNLKKAREQGKLDQFAKEHETDAPGDGDDMAGGPDTHVEIDETLAWLSNCHGRD